MNQWSIISLICKQALELGYRVEFVSYARCHNRGGGGGGGVGGSQLGSDSLACLAPKEESAGSCQVETNKQNKPICQLPYALS